MSLNRANFQHKLALVFAFTFLFNETLAEIHTININKPENETHSLILSIGKYAAIGLLFAVFQLLIRATDYLTQNEMGSSKEQNQQLRPRT